ncbi:MAG: hypothetical protein ACJA14_001295 [Ilumatobacter sp.]|jgi:hypothetical protein
MMSKWTRVGAVGAMVLSTVVAADAFGVSTGAQTADAGGIEFVGTDSTARVSDDEQMVVFGSVDAAGVSSIVIHDRQVGTSTLVADSGGGVNPSISGNGCIIAWSTTGVFEVIEPLGVVDPPVTTPPVTTSPVTTSPVTTPPVTVPPEPVLVTPATIQAIDRCLDGVPIATPTRFESVAVEDATGLGPPALSSVGSAIAVSSGDAILRLDLDDPSGEGDFQYAITSTFDAVVDPTEEVVTSNSVGISADGTLIIFASGTNPADVESFSVSSHAGGIVTQILAAATDPSVSDDGLVMAAHRATGIVVADLSTAPVVPVAIVEGARPEVSGDGNHVVFETDSGISVASWIGQGARLFETFETASVAATIGPSVSGPTISRLGSLVLNDLATPIAEVGTETDISLFPIAADASFDSELTDLGSGDLGALLTAGVTFTNRGAASMGIAELTVDGTFEMIADGCGIVVRPGVTCTIQIEFTVERLEDAFAVVTITPAVVGVKNITTEVTALGVAPIVIPPTTTVTTTPSGTTGGTTTGGSSGGTATTGSTTGGSTTRGSSTTGGNATTTTTTVPGAGVKFSPATFDFAATIIDAGRRTGLVEIVNSGTRPITVVGVRLESADPGPFEIVETTCVGESVPAGERCGITIAYSPTEIGTQTVQAIASLDGAELTAAVSGTGASAPTLAVVPGVATLGQVVTLTGGGFPTGLTVELTWAGEQRQVVVNDAGLFALPVVVLPKTRSGPAEASVAAQIDQFGDVSTTMLVTQTSDRSSPTVLRGAGINVSR